MNWLTEVGDFLKRASGASTTPPPLADSQEIKDLTDARLEMSAAATFLKEGLEFQLADMERRLVNDGRRGH